MELGTFTLSLTVQDMDSSVEFYQTLGFEIIDGGHTNEAFKDSDTMKWRIMEHPSVKIGLFQGMFDNNILTFNPKDVLSIQENLKKADINLIKETNESEAMKSIIFADPDGNQIMLDQH